MKKILPILGVIFIVFVVLCVFLFLFPIKKLYQSKIAAEPGLFFIHQETTISDEGTEEWANDDVNQVKIIRTNIEEGKIVSQQEIASLFNENKTGSIISEIVGKNILVHRYKEFTDAFLSLNGTEEAVQTTTDSGWWNVLLSEDGTRKIEWQYLFEEKRTGKTVMKIFDENNRLIEEQTFDPETFGLEIGHMEPFLLTEDKTTVYLRQVFEGGGYVAGLWAFDVETGETRSYPFIKEKHIWKFSIDPKTHMLIGITFIPQEFMGELPQGPSAVYLLDLKTEKSQTIFSDDHFAIANALLSPDGKMFAYSYFAEEQNPAVWIVPVGARAEGSTIYVKVSGNLLDWKQDWLVLNRNQELILYNIKTDSVLPIARSKGASFDPDYVSVDYVGILEEK